MPGSLEAPVPRVWLIAARSSRLVRALFAGCMLACSSPPAEVSDQTRMRDSPLLAGTGTQVVVVFNPATCTITADGFSVLNRLVREGGVRVQGVSVLPLGSDSIVRSIRSGFGIEFELVEDVGGRWLNESRRAGWSQPVVIVQKRGRVHAILMGDAIERLSDLVPVLFGTQGAPDALASRPL